MQRVELTDYDSPLARAVVWRGISESSPVDYEGVSCGLLSVRSDSINADLACYLFCVGNTVWLDVRVIIY